MEEFVETVNNKISARTQFPSNDLSVLQSITVTDKDGTLRDNYKRNSYTINYFVKESISQIYDVICKELNNGNVKSGVIFTSLKEKVSIIFDDYTSDMLKKLGIPQEEFYKVVDIVPYMIYNDVKQLETHISQGAINACGFCYVQNPKDVPQIHFYADDYALKYFIQQNLEDFKGTPHTVNYSTLVSSYFAFLRK